MKREEKQKIRFEELKSFDDKFRFGGIEYVCGIDEVGRGPLAGPVCVSAVVMPKDFYLLGIDDSKKVTEKKRNELAPQIREKAVAWSVVSIPPEIIDEINILEATKKAMKEALKEVKTKLEDEGKTLDLVLIDAVKIEGIDVRQENIVGGDGKSLSVAAASILAKVHRDKYMVDMSKKYMGYNFEKNKGYGTKEHCEALKAIGPCEIHRKSFIKNIVDKSE